MNNSCCLEKENYQSFAANVWIYGSPTLVILGTIGNILVGIVMLQKQRKKHTISIYLTYLAFLDTVILYTGLSRQWILARYGLDIRNESSWICKLHMFLMYYLIQTEAWLLTCVSIERVGAAWCPMKAKHFFTRRFAVIQMASFSGFLFAANAHLFWSQALIRGEAGNVCALNPDFLAFRMKLWGWLDMTLASILPFSVMITCNIAVVVKILNQQRKRGSSQETKVQSVTIMLLTVCVVFLLCTLPITIYLSDTDSFESAYGCCFSSYVLWPIFNMLLYLNNTTNFVLYCVSGTNFRQQLRAMLVCRSNAVSALHSCKSSQIATIQNHTERL
ncbi:hypothetical protein LSH36_428g00027 [Paralvinella palmiformis]|uniref:G-protein coupled receptors family 1 profile domain-containing protein n=1 Tax=Paralvinella palmiformis TaxID=53620 RepID=A0AAD9MY02_9ANNE|nr:hypothetical protein LSH36_428g00027 [Paralvinella palmiformis]